MNTGRNYPHHREPAKAVKDCKNATTLINRNTPVLLNVCIIYPLLIRGPLYNMLLKLITQQFPNHAIKFHDWQDPTFEPDETGW